MSTAALLWVVKAAAFGGKIFLAVKARQEQKKASTAYISKLWSILQLMLLSGAFGDLTWVIRLTKEMLHLSSSLGSLSLFFVRLAWIAGVLEYTALAIFLDKLANKASKPRAWHYFLLLCFSITAISLFSISLLQFHMTDQPRLAIESFIYSILLYYVPSILVISLGLFYTASNTKRLPKILQQQLQFLLTYFLIPHALLITIIPIALSSQIVQMPASNAYVLVACNDLLFLFMLFFCVKRMLGLRFLNSQSHVQAHKRYNFVDDFNNILARLGNITSLEEISHIVTSFFERAYGIKADQLRFSIRMRQIGPANVPSQKDTTVLAPIEQLLYDEKRRAVLDQIESNRILIRDEIEFDHFYAETDANQQILDLLTDINADLFLPIYERRSLVGYIVVTRNARPTRLFTNLERDEMCLFARYLGGVIHLLQHRNLSELVRQETRWQEDLYTKQQEINHCKESIRTLLKTAAQRSIGIIHIQRRKLLWVNETVRLMFDIHNPNEEHPTFSAALKKLAQEASQYGVERSLTLTGPKDRPILCTATPYGDKQVLILAYYADIADAFTIPFDSLQDLSSWEYALYLETTRSGQLISQLIPGSSQALLNFKTALLKLALSKKAILLELPEDDIDSIVTILHHISLRGKLHTLELLPNADRQKIGIQLFGMETIREGEESKPLLSTLHDIGTLCIKNIEYLPPELQEELATYFSTGMFHPLHSDRMIKSNTRVICTTTANLALLVEQQRFSAELFAQLRPSSLTMPSLLTLSRNDLAALAHQMSEHTIHSKEFSALIMLNERETNTIIDQMPASLSELRQKVNRTLHAKSARKGLTHLVQLEPASNHAHPELAHIGRLGKKALRDKQLVLTLWKAFESQAKIAAFLNVNKSSVNRRCKEFKIP